MGYDLLKVFVTLTFSPAACRISQGVHMMKSFLASAVVLALASSANAELIYGVTTVDGTSGAALVTFDSATPGIATSIAPITGVTNLRGIDFRPANGQLYGLGYTGSSAGGTAQLYTISTSTGAATPVGASLSLNLGNTTRVSLDFNPVVDRLRVVSGTGANVRLNPNDGTLAGTDTSLASSLLIGGVAYDRNNAGATQTTLFAYDYIGDNIGTIGGVNGAPSPNTGSFTVLGTTNPPITSFGADNGFDISGATGIAYLTGDNGPSATANDELYTINLLTGAATIVPTGLIDNEMTVNLLDISVVPVIPEPTSLATIALGSLLLKRRRA